MGYQGGDLSDLFTASTTSEPTRRLMREVAGATGDALTERAADNTPVRTGRLASQWRSLPVTSTPEGATGGTENRSPVAHLIEHGVKPHDLAPDDKNAMTTPQGPRASGRHPGFRGRHPLARAMAEVEHEVDAIAQPHLEEWADDIEANAKRHKGIE